MPITQRPFEGDADRRAMSALVHQFPAGSFHLADLPYRLSSWALDDPEKVALWADDDGQLVAWAVIQSPFWAIDYAYRPDLPEMQRAILAWADGRGGAALNRLSGQTAWYVNVLGSQQERLAQLEAAGFACQAEVPVDPWSKVWMARPAAAPIPDCAPPEFVTIRPLGGLREVDDYVELHRAAFETKNMTSEWRRRFMAWPEYVPDLDLVAVTPEGRFVAFCICWLDPTGFDGRPCGQVEPMGVADGYRQQGLGRAMLSEGLRRLRAMGVETMYVETDDYRGPALALYESAGFRVEEKVLVYRKDFE